MYLLIWNFNMPSRATPGIWTFEIAVGQMPAPRDMIAGLMPDQMERV